MGGWLQRLLVPRRGEDPRRTEQPEADERILALDRELQALRLDLRERDAALAALRRDLERAHGGEDARVAQAVRAQMIAWMRDAAAPAAQLGTQAHLLAAGGVSVRAEDVLAVAWRLVRVLEDRGLVLEGELGQDVAYDPDRHNPLGESGTLRPGERVTVRMAGVSCDGELLCKAGVDPAEG